MPVMRLDHVNIRTTHLAESIAFYGDLLGLDMRPPPTRDDFTGGAYGYDAGDVPIVHLVTADGENAGNPPIRGMAQPGMIDHFALRYPAGDAVLDRLTASGLDFNRFDVPMIGMHLAFVRDPNGVMVELGFPLDG